MKPVYLLVILGTSPAVLTELVWHLLSVEKATLAGIEVIGTTKSLEREALRKPWHALRRVFPSLPLLPDDAGDDSFRLTVLTARDGQRLDDIRTVDDAEQVDVQIQRRVRHHARRADATLVGSLAGGRKTMSAALQTAFSFQAPTGARLLHVLVHPAIEKEIPSTPDRPGRLKDYAFPDEVAQTLTGIPLAHQVVVHEIAFPRVRGLVARRRNLLALLDADDINAVWRALDRPCDALVLFTRSGVTGELRLVRSGAVVGRFKLGKVVYAAIRWLVENPDGGTPRDICTAIGASNRGSLLRQIQRLNREFDESPLCCGEPDVYVATQDDDWHFLAATRVRIEREVVATSSPRTARLT